MAVNRRPNSAKVSSSYPKIQVRRARISEIHSLCGCLAQAFMDDPMFGDFIHPLRHRYPSDMERYWLKRIPKEYFKPSEVFLVATERVTMPDTGKEGEIITGVAHWQRDGEQAELRRLGWATVGWWDIRNVFRFLANIYSSIEAYIYPNRAEDSANSEAFDASLTFSDHYWTGSRFSSWYLELLGVHPAHRNKGIGRALVAWGMQRAQAEGVSCSVVSAKDKDMFYQRCGFDCFVGNAGEGEGNPVGHVPGGNIYFKDFQHEKDEVQVE